MQYSARVQQKKSKWPRRLVSVLLLVLIAVGAYFIYNKYFAEPTVTELIELNVSFDSSLTQDEIDYYQGQLEARKIRVESPLSIRASLSEELNTQGQTTTVLLPVTAFGSIKQRTNTAELADAYVILGESISGGVRELLTDKYGFTTPEDPSNRNVLDVALEAVALVDAENLTSEMQLLSFNENYYLDDFNSGAIFREIVIEGDNAADLNGTNPNNTVLLDENSVFKVNMTGVTALTRIMQRKLAEVGDPLYFSEKIGDFLADADLTHVSNEVSFKPDCEYSNTLFCSPPEFIDTLKASGVDLVELTGNHNNDRGSEYNTQTIELYKSLGWNVVGGGANAEEAQMPFFSNQKNSEIAFLAYNYPDSPNGGAIATETTAGANYFDFSYATIEKNIAVAKEQSDFVIVNVQFWECYAYPDGYIEFPSCDNPIGEQEETFKKLIELGADMVVGSSAHQPQTFELYQGKPIYYGLGNLYFDQTSWPGTERGIVLTHYFANGKLLQTKLTPTVYDEALQTRIMTEDEAEYLFERLQDARLSN
jgi:hypothetical protein